MTFFVLFILLWSPNKTLTLSFSFSTTDSSPLTKRVWCLTAWRQQRQTRQSHFGQQVWKCAKNLHFKAPTKCITWTLQIRSVQLVKFRHLDLQIIIFLTDLLVFRVTGRWSKPPGWVFFCFLLKGLETDRTLQDPAGPCRTLQDPPTVRWQTLIQRATHNFKSSHLNSVVWQHGTLH